MSAVEVHQKINVVELALKNAGPEQAMNATIDVLKEIARTLEALEKPISEVLSSKPTAIPTVPQTSGRKFRDD